ncbi:MAG TPA: hypothetical protein VMW69_11345, partial [Spirochaetia bacterium]|nr:hypothetical protein [Spirochaetia bacterium]
MMGRCSSVKRRIQLYFDGEAALGDRDVLHIHACSRCGGLFRGYSRFRADLRIASGKALGALAAPDWGTVFEAAALRENESAVATGTAADSLSETDPFELNGGSRRLRGYAHWATGTLTKAAALLILVGIGTVVGIRGL